MVSRNPKALWRRRVYFKATYRRSLHLLLLLLLVLRRLNSAVFLWASRLYFSSSLLLWIVPRPFLEASFLFTASEMMVLVFAQAPVVAGRCASRYSVSRNAEGLGAGQSVVRLWVWVDQAISALVTDSNWLLLAMTRSYSILHVSNMKWVSLL